MRWVDRFEDSEAERGTTPIEQYAIRLGDVPIPSKVTLCEVVGVVELLKQDIIKTSLEEDE